jgi:hypothetical protein
MLEFSKDNPRRPVDWRWQRANALVEEGGRPSRTYDDEGTFEALKFLRRLNSCTSESQRRYLAEDVPDIYWAHDFYQSEGDVLRIELEARILSDDTDENIGLRLCIEPQTVSAYEKLFFSIRDRLDNPGYIYHQVIGRSMHRGLSEREFESLWKWYGYTYGPVMLDSLINQTVDPKRPAKITDVKAAWRSDGHGSLLRKQAIAARTMPVNSFTQVDLLHIYAKFSEIEKNSGVSGAREGEFFTNVSAMMELLPWGVGRRAVVDPKAITDHEGVAAELRTDELMKLAVGEDVPELANLEDVKFPEAPNEKDE